MDFNNKTLPKSTYLVYGVTEREVYDEKLKETMFSVYVKLYLKEKF